MNVSATLFNLFAGIFAVLALASAVGALLKRRAAPDAPSAAIDNLNARLKAWWVMIALIALAIWAGDWGVILLFGFISFQSLREFVSLTHTRRGDHRALIWSFYVFLPLQYILIATHWYGLFTILIPVYAFLLLPISASLGSDTTRFLERAAKVQWGLMICVYCISHVPALLTLDIEGHAGANALLIVFLVLTVQSSDVFQYVWGKLLGRHKLAPVISPSKTLEGLVGGVASATLVGAALWWITPFTPLQAGALAALIVLCGFLGGLALSAVKRSLGAKDWGVMIEGHGGMLDRMDSVSFAAPVFFHLTRYFFAG